MTSNEMFEVKMCYYGVRENLVTHILCVHELSTHLEMTPDKVRDYIATRLNTCARLEGKTLKVKGLLTTPIMQLLVQEIHDNL